MSYRKVLPLAVAVTLLAAAVAVGQHATLVYADDLGALELESAEGASIEPQFGATVPAGTTIRTGGTTAELTIAPSGTLLKLAEDTDFTLERVDVGTTATDHSFRLSQGKIRTVVREARGDRYRIRTPNAVAGVRGTDFAQRVVAGQTDWICVLEGEVTFTRIQDQTRLSISAQQFADTFDEEFRAESISRSRLREIFSDVQFVELDPDE